MKLHKNLLDAVVSALQSIFVEGYYADKVIERTFKQNRQWGSRDRKFIAQAVYDIVRWKSYLSFLLQQDESEAQDLLAVWLYDKKENDMLLRPEQKSVIQMQKNTKPPYHIAQAFPQWLYQYAWDEIGESWHEIAASLNQEAKLYIRANAIKNSREDLRRSLENEGVEAIPILDVEDGLVIPSKQNIFQTKSFKLGLFEVQDASSQMVCPNLKLKAGDRFIDACAGAGGKTLHAASLMHNKGKIIALDIHEKKLQQLKIRSRRNGVDIIEIRKIEGSKTIKRLKESADAILLDVPCSGLGVLKRNPDTKWKLTKERLSELQKIQADIIERYSVMLKPGGRMVYATCSLLPSENERQIELFLKNHSDYRLLAQKTLRPDIQGYDGFFFAVLQKA